MQIYTGIISKNVTPYTEDDPFLNDHIKVRIPDFHGPKTESAYDLLGEGTKVAISITSDDDLPWATINRGFDNNLWSAQSFNEDDLVFVLLQNGDVNSPIIMGFASRFSYTEDPEIATENYLNSDPQIITLGQGYGFGSGLGGFGGVPGASTIVSLAEGEVGYIAKRSNSQLEDKTANPYSGGSKYTKYMLDMLGYAGGDWCAVFICWLFNKAGYGEYFCDGQKTASCNFIKNSYSKAGRYESGHPKDAKAGDIVFFNFKGGSSPSHVGLVVQDQVGSGPLSTIEGNTSGFGYGSCVNKKSRSSNIVGLARTGVPLVSSVGLVDDSTNEGKVWNCLVSYIRIGDKPLNNAALCGIMGNFHDETGGAFNPVAYWDDTNGKGSFGIAQWNGDRRIALKNWCDSHGEDYRSISGQIKYLNVELNESAYAHVSNYLLSVPNTKDGAGDAALYFAQKFEVCAEYYNGKWIWKTRVNNAKDTYWPKYGNLILNSNDDELLKLFKQKGELSKPTKDIVLVADSKAKNLTLYKKSNNKYAKQFTCDAYFGKNGITSGNRTGGDGKTPKGLHSLGFAFGISANPGISKYTYKTVTKNSCWILDPSSSSYNSWVESFTSNGPKSKRFADYPSKYKYAVVINYNTGIVNRSKGPAVFLSCGTGATDGDVAVSDVNMMKILSNLSGYSTGSAQILIC